jgi:hypothetical protein
MKRNNQDGRIIEFLMGRTVGLFDLIFLFRLTALTAIQFRSDQEPSLRGASKKFGLTSADSGLQLDLEIALSGVPAKIQPHGLLQPSQGCVETSGDEIESLGIKRRAAPSRFFL